MTLFRCPGCGKELDGSGFYFSKGRRSGWCRSCILEDGRRRYADPVLRAARLSRQRGAASRLRRNARRRRLRKSGDPKMLGENLRIRFCLALSGKVKRAASAVRDLGCPLEEFRSYLASKFLPGMSWGNRGSLWEVDHIVPFHRVDLSDPEAQRKVCHFTNLRPLFRADNQARNRRELLDAELAELGLLLPDGTIRFPCDQVPKHRGPQVPKSPSPQVPKHRSPQAPKSPSPRAAAEKNSKTACARASSIIL